MNFKLLGLELLIAGACFASSIVLPGGTLTVVGTSTVGTSFTYSGTLTQNDTLGLTASGSPSDPCLQSGPQYCTNAGGVLTILGNGAGVGGTSTFGGTFNGTSATWNFGSLLLEISGVSGPGTVQLFAANAADGLGSSNPPTNLTLADTTLAALGFGSFSVVDPTITFILADDNYPDNSNSFVLTQGVSGVPEPSSGLLIGSGLSLLGWLMRRRIGKAA